MNTSAKSLQIHLPLGNNAYDIYIGEDMRENMEAFLQSQKFSPQCLIITDANVGAVYGEYYAALLGKAGFNPKLITLPPGEETKSLQMAEEIYTAAIEHNLDRKSPIFALGGGVVGDLAGFIAATFMRGVPFIQIPTSLLAQVDSSVGGKVAVNHALGKNLIGAFYQPKAVFIDVNTLRTLPKREIATGMGEIIKYAYIYDAELLELLQNEAEAIKELQIDIMKKLIYRCCSIKAEVVVQDEKESSLRAILNFGHTLGHAIETATNYQVYNHGEAVAVGMVAAAYLSKAQNNLEDDVIEEMKQLLGKYDLPVKAEGLNGEELYGHLFHDKKTVAGKINWILLHEVGKVYQSKAVDKSDVMKAIAEIV